MEDFESTGAEGETDFRDWLDERNAAYLPIEQTPETLALQFQGIAKRPDLLLFPGETALAAIDVKTKKPGFWLGAKVACVGLNKSDIDKLAAFERLSGIPVYIVFFDGWNPGFEDMWRIAMLSELKPLREFDTYILLDINRLPLVANLGGLMRK